MHDNIVRTADPTKLVRFHATIPPPNDHSHGYWHVVEDMNVQRQADMSIFDRPALCLPSCGLSSAHEAPTSGNAFMPWVGMDEAHLEELAGRMRELV